MKKVILVLFGIGVLAGLGFLVPTLWFRPWSVDHFFARSFIQFAMRHPMMLSQLGMLDSTPFDFHSDKLDDFSVAATRAESAFVERQLEIASGYDLERLTRDQRLSAEVGQWFLRNQREGNQFLFHGYPVNQLFGIQSQLPDFMINTHPMKKPKDARNYITRVSKFGTAIDQILEGLELRERQGIVPPRFVLTKVLAQMNDFVGSPPEENPLYTNFATKLDSIGRLDSVRREQLQTRLVAEVENTVYPAYRKLIDYCARLESEASTEDGVWKLPDGDDYYAYRLRSSTTTDMPADSIHALGLREVVRIQDQIRGILKTNGYPTADLAATLRTVAEETRFQYPDADEGRDRILSDYQGIIDDADRRARELFHVRPPTGVEVKRIPAFQEATAPAAYYQPPAIGGSRPGRFFVNLRSPGETSRIGMRTLAYHEAVPGHHFQISIMRELKGVPFFRRVLPFTAYTEGWGLYAERLALEHGFHQDAFDSLGALQAELFRAVRLVVDTGIHHERWTRDQAIEYMLANTGMKEPEIVTEVERYIVNPGQACAYKVGQLKILELRDRAMKQLGSNFDIRDFHDVVLTNGAMPLALLERVVEEWMRSDKPS